MKWRMRAGLKKCISWTLVFVMSVGLLTLSESGYAEAADDMVTVENAADATLPVHVVLTADPTKRIPAGTWGTNSPSQDIEQYDVSLVNGTASTISDWTITITSSDASSYNSGWNGVSRNGNVITIVPHTETSWSNAEIAAGNSGSGAGFQIAASAIAGATVLVTYKVGASSGGGNSGGGGDSGYDGSNIGSIDTSQNYNFAKLLQLSLYFYDANMCGDEVEDKSMYSSTKYNGWRGNCHVNDYFMYNGVKYPATGGFHDAGDHVKFGLPMAESFVTLGLAYKEFGSAFDELGQTGHFRTIVDHYCEYVRRCTVLNADGDEAVAFCYQVGSGQPDHESWVAPEVEDESKTKRASYLVATASNPATEYVAESAAALAINYINFGNEEDLKYAKALFAMAMKNEKKNGDTDTTGSFYAPSQNGDSFEDEYCLGAAILYQITKDGVYKEQYDAYNKNNGNLQKPHGWSNVFQAAALYAPTKNDSEWSTMKGYFDSVASSNSAQYYCDSSWGSARINCNVQFMMLLYDKLNQTDTYNTWCRYQMSIILGNNATGNNLVCGYNGKSPTHPHHRAASGYSGWDEFNANADQKYTLYGALCGGPTSSDFSTYKDVVNDAVCNEVTLDYNAGMVGAAAALYLAYKDCTEEGFNEQKVLSDFYVDDGTSTPSDPITPSDPSDPNTPSDPSDPSTPSDSGASSNPANPSDPSTPSDQTNPNSPGTPSDQANPGGNADQNGSAPSKSSVSVKGRTASAVTVTAGEKGLEIGIRKVGDTDYTWTALGDGDTVINGLTEYTDYELAVRYTGTTSGTSGVSILDGTITTYLSNPYIIDLALLARDGEKYAGALVTSDGNKTISYDPGTKTVTLLGASEQYQLVGQPSGNDLTILNQDGTDYTDVENTGDKASSILVTATVSKAPAVNVSGTWKLAPKKKLKLAVSFQPDNAVSEEVIYTSSNEKIVKVDQNGLVTAGKKAGTAKITVTTAGGLTKTINVKVMKKAVSKMSIQAKKTVKAGKKLQLKAVISPGKKYASNQVIWTTNKPQVATVNDKGVVKTLKKGKVKITAVAADGSGKKAVVTIRVK